MLSAAAAVMAENEGFLAFHGGGSRLDGKKKNLHTPLQELVQNVSSLRLIYLLKKIVCNPCLLFRIWIHNRQ